MVEKYLIQIQQGIKQTNSYWSINDVIAKLNNNSFVESQSNALFFFKKTRYNFSRLYFYIQDIGKINWSFFQDQELIVEIVIRNSKKEK